MAEGKVEICSESDLPLIVILGSTGVGKSKLGIEIGKVVKGEIISADSMQVYKGLDIITAKVTKEEQEECKHHLIDVVSPSEHFNVVNFRKLALPIIFDITKRGKIPIVVGGTNYYIESLLWNILVDNPEVDGDNNPATADRHHPKHASHTLDQMTDSNNGLSSSHKLELHKKLMEIDPVMALRLHPNDSRKIARSLKIYETHQKLPSEILLEQKQQTGADHLGGPLRFTNALVFWINCEKDIHDKRLSDRVDDMVKQGLLEEISSFHERYNSERLAKHETSEPYTEGIFQAIGFKEFHDYLICDPSTDSKGKDELFRQSVEALKQVTIRYAKKQKAWVRNRFLARPEMSSPKLYELDANDLSKWTEKVLNPALEAVHAFLKGNEIPLQPVERFAYDPCLTNKHKQHICEICNNKLIIGDNTWEQHCASRGHKKLSSKRRKLNQT